MIEKTGEFRRMFLVEEQLWWYRHLHDLVMQRIQKRFGSRKGLTILDAGCGTGGLLHRLRQAGYTDSRGVDGSVEGVAFCQERGLTVDLLNLNDLSTYIPSGAPPDGFDVIICNDVFCYFRDPELNALIGELRRRLRPGGVLISNNNAYNVFKGEHDLAVGSLRRFVKADFEKLAPANGLRIQSATYWSFVLSPLILFIRQWQALQLRLGWRSAGELVSDVELPGALVNRFLYSLVGIERKLIPIAPFGSSLFLEMEAAG
ncbi:methyltransferase domain-containing protein [uncultured Fibrella sp.]|uniref:class I SAM-dependent methyltransferase n=1 Tax=uncultured Fibrella sp. TaxID=1284596 RepID=UPI0035CC613E